MKHKIDWPLELGALAICAIMAFAFVFFILCVSGALLR